MLLPLLLACAAELPVQGPPPPQPASPAARWFVDEARAQVHVRELAALGPRMGGTASGDRAAAWLADRFAALGLAVRTTLDTEKLAHAESSWLVVVQPEGAEPWIASSAWPYGFSPAGFGEAVLALEGGAAPEGAHVLLAGKRSTPRAGAALPACILLDGNTTLDGRYPVVHHLAARESGNVPAFGLSRGDGERLRAHVAAGTRVRVAFALDAVIRRGQPRTVVATLPARAGAPPGHLLYCAHGDSDAGGPGANDNASGVAVLLEIAAAWRDAIAAGVLPEPAREVRFAVWGSEIHSTRDYLESIESGPDTALAVINYDQVGFGSGFDRFYVEPDDLPANTALVRSVAALLRARQAEPGFPAEWATMKSLGGTDSYVFSGSKLFRDAGRPAITLYTSAWGRPAEHPRTPGMPGEAWHDRDRVAIDHDVHYHSAGDTAENTTDREPWNMGWCARVGLLAGHAWLEAL